MRVAGLIWCIRVFIMVIATFVCIVFIRAITSNPLLTLVRRNAVLLLHVSRQNAMILVGCLVLVSAREGPPGLPPTTGRGAAAGPRWA